MRGHAKRFMIAVIVSCSLMLTAQIAFQSYLLAIATEEKPYGSILVNCVFKTRSDVFPYYMKFLSCLSEYLFIGSRLESALRQLGLQRYSTKI